MTVGKNLLIVFFIALASGALAQIDPDPNGLGIYFDQGATVVSADLEVDEFITGYLIATNCTETGFMMWWQCGVCVDNGVLFGSVTNGHNYLGFMPFSECKGFICSGGPPITGITILAEIDFFATNPDPINITINGIEYDGDARLDGMFYTTTPDYSDSWTYFNPSSGSEELPVATINGPVVNAGPIMRRVPVQ